MAPIVGLQDLLDIIPQEPTTAIIVGYNWTLVQSACGSGLVSTPPKGRNGAGTTPTTGRYTGMSLRALAKLAQSGNPYECAVGCAAINAGTNRVSRTEHIVEDGLAVPQQRSGRVVVVGRFPGLNRKIPDAVVLECDPGPHDLPASAAADVIPGCSRLLVTASAWRNGTLAGLLALAQGAHVSLIGPGTPLSPVLHRHGIHRLAGFVPTDREALRQAVAEGAGVSQFRHLGRTVVLEHSP